MKIISMSVWGNDPRYIIGALKQYELAQLYYPDWQFRIYTDNRNKFIGQMLKAHIIECKDGSYGMYWRFQPLFEHPNNIVLVRDSDSRITYRESLAVKEWLQSKKKFHTFRDHEAHFEFPIIGCAFGHKGQFNGDAFDKMLEYRSKFNYYVGDQIFLRDIIYPLVKDDILVHSMNEGWFGETRTKLVNPYDFCGNGYDENDMPLYAPTLAENHGFKPKDAPPGIKFNNGLLK
jgi:hypothetical protein